MIIDEPMLVIVPKGVLAELIDLDELDELVLAELDELLEEIAVEVIVALTEAHKEAGLAETRAQRNLQYSILRQWMRHKHWSHIFVQQIE